MIPSVKAIDLAYNTGTESNRILCYADDAIFIVENEDGIQPLLYRFTQTKEKFNMQISTEKTQSMLILNNHLGAN